MLVVEGLSKHFSQRHGLLGLKRRPIRAVEQVGFDLAKGEVLGLVGESGSGKSTLGRAILRLIEPTSGRVRFDGIDVTALAKAELRRLRRRMQIVFQDPYASLNPNMTVREIVREGIDVFSLAKTRAEGNERVDQLLSRVGLDGTMATRYPHEFSGGHRQRIAIANALISHPRLLVPDEPVSALDESIRSQIMNLFKDSHPDNRALLESALRSAGLPN